MADINHIGGIHYEMMRRCYNQNCLFYKQYGAIGITVCEEWHDRETFRQWAKENGYKKGLRLNRIDPSKGYSPDNCYFGTLNKAKHGYNELVRKRAKENKLKKKEIGVKRLTDSPLYLTYIAMKDRCKREKHMNYARYGGRGITVCKEWNGREGFYNFSKWSISNGWMPGLTLDRIDNDKGYSPDNCRWATRLVQADNKSNIIHYNYKGFSLSLTNIARMENINPNSLRYRVKYKGMTIEDAVNELKSK